MMELFDMAKLSDEERKRHQSQASIKYDASNTTRVFIKLNLITDADIISYLQTVSNKQGLFKQLIRSHMSSAGFVYSPTEEE